MLQPLATALKHWQFKDRPGNGKEIDESVRYFLILTI